MKVPVVVVAGITIVAILVVVLLRHVLYDRFAARRAAAPPGLFVWSMLAGSLTGGIVILLAGIQMWATAPLVGAVMVVGGGIYLAVVLPFLARLHRAVTSASTTEPVELHMNSMLGLWLIGPLAFFVWAVSQAVR
jgi:hypothetical protein